MVDWPDEGVPPNGYNMMELIESVQKQQQASGNKPIIIHCRFVMLLVLILSIQKPSSLFY